MRSFESSSIADRPGRGNGPHPGLRHWAPSLGAVVDQRGGVVFRVWAPERRTVEVVIAEDLPSLRLRKGVAFPLTRQPGGYFEGWHEEFGEGMLYWYRLDGDRLLPDPASRFQPQGVHGPSAVVNPRQFRWRDEGWSAPPLKELAIYELHVGCFSREGSFQGVTSRLDDLARLGVSALELMPVAEFGGRRNWGYDGVDLFAPCHHYGTPDDLRQLVDAAHARRLAVFLDVVYNHLGPDGAYLSAFSPHYFTDRHRSPWGDGVNFDGDGSEDVRRFFLENALHWIHEYHVDGLRLDATHAMQDDSRKHFLCELSETVRERAASGIVLVAEDERNLNALVQDRQTGGYGLDGVWSDDFHHQMRRLLAGDSEGYFARFSGAVADLATTIEHGWYFRGQPEPSSGRCRGTDPNGLPLDRFVFCLQNHDQVGNRAFGERLHHQVDLAAYRAASALLFCVPETPLLFMGQEWAASSPFLYFTDHEPELGSRVTEGRRGEFAAFSAFADAAVRDRIPDPQAEATFARSRLNWDERDRMPHLGIRRLYGVLLRLRRAHPALRSSDPRASSTTLTEPAPSPSVPLEVRTCGESSLLVRRSPDVQGEIMLVAHFKGEGRVDVATLSGAAEDWDIVLTTEDAPFADNGRRPVLKTDDSSTLTVDFAGPAAVVLARKGEGLAVLRELAS